MGRSRRARIQAPAKIEISLERDGTKVAFPFGSVVAAVAEVTNTVTSLVTTILEMAPKIGWYAEWQMHVMGPGEIVAEWGYKEHEDERCFLGLKFGGKLTIFSAAIEAGFGVAGLGFAAQIYVKLEGGVDLGLDVARVHPDAPWALTIPASGKLEGSIGAKIAAGEYLNVEAVGKTGLELGIKFHFDRGQPFQFEIVLTFTGVTASVTAKVGKNGSYSCKIFEKNIAKKKEIGIVRLPATKPYQPPFLDEKAIETTIGNVLTRGLNVRVRDRDNNNRKLNEVATEITKRIHEERNLRRDGLTIKGIADAARQQLDILGVRLYARDWVSAADFDFFMKRDEFPKEKMALTMKQILEGCIDTGLDLIAANEEST